jgi:hypothetical protein
MPDVLEPASAWLAAKVMAWRSRTVSYWRGDDAASILAVQGRSDWPVVEASGAQIMLQTRDYLVRADDLETMLGAGARPEAGDRVVEASGEAFEVRAPGGQRPWRWSDEYNKLLRIHTTRVEAGA